MLRHLKTALGVSRFLLSLTNASDANLLIVVPWGRITSIRKDIVAAGKPESEGGSGVGLKFWDWTEEQVKPYL